MGVATFYHVKFCVVTILRTPSIPQIHTVCRCPDKRHVLQL